MAINFKKYIVDMKAERYISSFIYGDANFGKTKFVKDFISKNKDLKIAYFDLIDELDKLEDKAQIILFSPRTFVSFILNLIREFNNGSTDAVIIDNIDVVLNRWGSSNTSDFAQQMSKIDNTTFSLPIIAFVQTDLIFEDLTKKQIINQIPKIFNIRELEGI